MTKKMELESYKNRVAEILEEQVADIKEKVSDGVIYGIPIDVEDTNMLIVASYYFGYQVAKNELERDKELEELFDD